MPEHRDPFYIGYLAAMPAAIASRVRVLSVIFAGMVLISALVIAVFQKPFSDGVFEFGTLTEVSGVLQMKPVPRIVLQEGEVRKAVLLVGFGKCGAHATIEEMENQRGILLDGFRVTVRGTLIYDDLYTMLELTEGAEALVKVGDRSGIDHPVPAGSAVIRGEVIDPKCCLGTMKPGMGKTHRACGVRCVSGGITPMLRTIGTNGIQEFVVLVGPDGKQINQSILGYLADEVSVSGDIFLMEDWRVLVIDRGVITRI